MRFDAVANLWFAALAALIVLLYILKARRRDVTVSSTFLWDQLLRDIEAVTPWQRLRHNILMYLQILGIALLALALARPSIISGGLFGRSTVILIDGSGSMRASDEAPDRFAVAVKRSMEMVNAMRPGDSVAVVLMQEEPRPVVPLTRDRRAALSGLASLSAGYGRADAGSAISLAASILAGRPSPTIMMISDGAGTSTGLEIPDGIALEHVPVGTATSHNYSVLSVGTRPWSDGVAALVRVANYGPESGAVTLEVSSGGLVVATRNVTIESGKIADVAIEGLSRSQYVSARIRGAGDELAEDDALFAIPESGSDLSILLVTNGNAFMEKALSLRAGATVYTVGTEKYEPSPRYGLYVFDGWLPPALPDAPVFVLDPPARVGPVTPGRQIDTGKLSVVNPDHPVMRFVDASDVAILKSMQLNLGPGAVSLVNRDGPVISAWEDNKTRGIALGFDVHQSDWPLRPSFPVFVINALDWLVPEDISPGTHIAGRPANLSLPVWVRSAALVAPEGSRQAIVVAGPSTTVTPLVPGLYSLELVGENRKESRVLTVQLDRAESNLRASTVGPKGTADGAGSVTGRPLWLPLAGIALSVLTFEWWLFTRGL